MRGPAIAVAATGALMTAHARAEEPAVWKFGYGSNMSQQNLRQKKQLNPLGSRRTVVRGFSLSFPAGRGIDFVEPAFATLKRDPEGEVHGVSCLLCRTDADSLDRQEGAYGIEVCRARVYDDDASESLDVEVYVPGRPLPRDHPEGCCSQRYKDLLVRGAVENDLDAAWIAKLRALPVYTPSQSTLSMRAALPAPSELPQMSIEQLRAHNGSGRDCLVSACGFIFKHTPIFSSYRGRDVTFRNLLHLRGINIDANDDGGQSPFPNLAQLTSAELEYCLQNRDRLMHKSEGGPVAVLREFWEEQDYELKGIFSGNSLSRRE